MDDIKKIFLTQTIADFMDPQCDMPYIKFVFDKETLVDFINHPHHSYKYLITDGKIQGYVSGHYIITTVLTERAKEYYNTKLGRARALLRNYNEKDKEAGRGVGNLTPEWIVENIFSKPCAHCGEKDWHNIGCNRIDNDLPHTPDNVEPCCFNCNIKQLKMERSENGKYKQIKGAL